MDGAAGPPLVGEDWHAVCQAIFWRPRGRRVEEHCAASDVDMGRAENIRHPNSSRKAKTVRKCRKTVEKQRRMETSTAIRTVGERLKAVRQCGKRCGKNTYKAQRPFSKRS